MRAWRHAALLAGVAALYFAAGWLGLELFTLVHPAVTAVWPATGVAVAAFLVYGSGLWPAILGSLVISIVTTVLSAMTSTQIYSARLDDRHERRPPRIIN